MERLGFGSYNTEYNDVNLYRDYKETILLNAAYTWARVGKHAFNLTLQAFSRDVPALLQVRP